jgi:DNA modification methylase
MLSHSSARRIPLKDNSIHFAITSPPYWSLRLYSSLDPEIWGGDPGCRHVWGSQLPPKKGGQVNQSKWSGNTAVTDGNRAKSGAFCQYCGAWRGLLGNEPDPFLFVDHLVEVFREVKRVLHPKGTLIINMGDTWMGSGGAHTHDHANPGISQSASRGGYRADKGRGTVKKHPNLKPKDKALIPQRLAIALQEDGWWVRQDWEWVKSNGLPNSATDRPTFSHEYMIMCSKSERYYWDYVASMLPTSPKSIARETRGLSADHKMINGAPMQAPHSFLAEREANPNRKPPPLRRYRTTDPFFDSLDDMIATYEVYLNHLKACRSEGLLIDEAGKVLGSISSTNQFEGSHFATYPDRLIRPLIAAGCPQKVCSECGDPWVRQVESTPATSKPCPKTDAIYQAQGGAGEKKSGTIGMSGSGRIDGTTETTGCLPQCACPSTSSGCTNAPSTPGIVLDPFIGSGTTVRVAKSLGLRAIGLDMSAEYLSRYAAPLAENIVTEASLEQARSKKKKKTKVAKQQLSLF